jgi:exocyst complex component 4
MAEAKKLLGRKNNHLGQLWYRSLTLRHVLSLLDQVEDVAKVPARIENLMAEKQLYAAVQLHVQSMVMLEREGLQAGKFINLDIHLSKCLGSKFAVKNISHLWLRSPCSSPCCMDKCAGYLASLSS